MIYGQQKSEARQLTELVGVRFTAEDLVDLREEGPPHVRLLIGR